MNDIIRAITLKSQTLQAMEKHPIRNFAKIGRMRREIKALTEVERDILNPAITQTQSTSGVVDKNNYISYSGQVSKLYDMYSGATDYGSEVARGVVDTRVAFTAGEGLSVIAEDGWESPTQKFIDDFIQQNKLNGSRLMNFVEIGELEGKALAILRVNGKGIKVSPFSWYVNRYQVNVKETDRDIIQSITYKPKNDLATDQEIDATKAVFIRLGGTEKNINDTTNRIHCVLTDIENYSRAKYDLRTNTHLFGKVMPYWKTGSAQDARAINTDIASKNFVIGMGYAGTADFSLVEPSGSAAKAIIEDILISLKSISLTIGIPVHFLAWPELMSNRATAENLMELVASSTKKERLIWEESFTEIIEKARIMAVDTGLAGNEIMGKFQVRLPLVSMALVKQIIDVWKPLVDEELISTASFLNILPSINPSREIALLEKQKAEKGNESPLHNGTIKDTIESLKKGGKYEVSNKDESVE